MGNIKNIYMIAYTNYLNDARVRREAETMAQNGYDVTVFVLSENKKPRTYDLSGVTVAELHIQKYQGKNLFMYVFSYFRFLFKAFLSFTGAAFTGKVDIVHVHNMPDFLVFAALVPKLFGKKIILDVHDSMPETFVGKFGNIPHLFLTILKFEEYISTSFANHIVCVNEPQKQCLVDRGVPDDKITVLLNVPDHRIFGLNENRKPDAHSDKFNIVYHGTLDRSLGIDIGMKAVGRLAEQIPSIQFNIIGGGKDSEEFIILRDELGLHDTIQFSKKIYPVEQLPGILTNMDIGLIPNRKNEATKLMLPVKMMEYISLGIPVIVPRLKTIMYYFDENMVSFYEPEDIDSMTEAILRLYNDPSLRKSQAENAKAFLARYGWNKHQNDLLQMYVKLLK